MNTIPITFFANAVQTHRDYVKKAGKSYEESLRDYTTKMENRCAACIECIENWRETDPEGSAAQLETLRAEFLQIRSSIVNSMDGLDNESKSGKGPFEEHLIYRALFLVNLRLVGLVINALEQNKDARETGTDSQGGPAQTQKEYSEWLYTPEEVEEFTHGLVRHSNVKSKKWREENNFPFKQSGYKSAVMYSKKEITKWMSENNLTP